MLEQKDGRKAMELIQRVFRDYSDYSTDIRVYRDTRRALLDEYCRWWLSTAVTPQ